MKASLKQVIKFLPSNCFIKLWEKVFQQVTETPMGSHAALFFPNLFHSYYENNLLKKFNTNIGRASHFVNVFRFIDDPAPLNFYGEFERCLENLPP